MPKKKPKLLYIITKANWGGAQRYVYDLATNISRSSYNIVVVSGKEGVLTDKLSDADIRTHVLPLLGRDINFIKDIFSFVALIKTLRAERPDVVHLNSSKVGALGALAARLTGVKKIIFTAHGWAFKEERKPFSRFLIHLASWLTVALSHKTITVSENDFEKARWMPFVKRKIVMIHNGIGPQEFLEKEEARKQLSGGIKSTFWIGTIAELNKNKGLIYALSAIRSVAESVPSVRFFIIGIGEDEEKLRHYVSENNLDSHVYFLGYVENASRYLKAFDILTLTSIKEGLPYTILEAGAAGQTVVATAVGGVPEVIDDMRSGILIKPRDPDELAKALLFLHKRKEKRAALGKVLKRKVGKEFKLSTMVRKTLATYRE